MRYSFDTSAFVNPWQKYYRPRRFPQFWHRLDELVTKGRVACHQLVLHELKQQDDDIHAWVKERKSRLVSEIDDRFQQSLQEVMQLYGPTAIEIDQEREWADPCVIALAMVDGSVVISDEKPKTHRPTKRKKKQEKIPDICRDLGIQHFYIYDLIEQEDWTF